MPRGQWEAAEGFKSCVTLGRAKAGNQLARRAASLTRESESTPHLSAFCAPSAGAAFIAEG